MKRRISPELILSLGIGAALLAALLLGGFAFFLARHEESFRREELRELLRAECRLFAERCGQELDMIRAELEQRAAQTPPNASGIRDAIATEPFFVEGFLSDRSGRLLYAGGQSQWRRRYDPLFTELVSARKKEADTLQSNIAPEPAREQKSIVEPVRTRQLFRPRLAAESKSAPLPAPSMAFAEAAETADAAIGAAETPRMIPRFSMLTRETASGFIPYFTDNRFAPLVWAQSESDPQRIVGFELESVVFWSRLIPLFPQQFPDYFRIELVDASDRVIHVAGGDISKKEKTEAVLIMPFTEFLLPNAQIRASLIPSQLPLSSFRVAVWLGISAPVLVILLAGLLVYRIIRRELRLATQKTGFVSQVSHELKTPLTSIRMYSELLNEHDQTLPQSKRRIYLRILQEESERLSRLVGNILDFGRLDAGRKRYAPETVDLAELLRSAVELNRDRAESSDIELRMQLPKDETLTKCRIDRDSLLQILHNLFDNAFKYAPESKWIDLELARGEKSWVIRLRDYGPGVPPGAEEKIFRKFYRVDTALGANVSGFGLGLAIARNLLRDQGGELKARRVSPGLQFIIILPGEPDL